MHADSDMSLVNDIRNTRKIRAVVADGRLYGRTDLDRLLATIEALNIPADNRE